MGIGNLKREREKLRVKFMLVTRNCFRNKEGFFLSVLN